MDLGSSLSKQADRPKLKKTLMQNCQGMQATAKVQGVEPPFDPTYVPSATNQALFD
jgi:hypothetical protein